MTKIVEVFHVKDLEAPNGRSLLGEIGDGKLPIDVDKNHEKVADVEVESVGIRALDEAYKLTQNIEDSWTKNAAVETRRERCRSTHIGDVLRFDGKAFVCAPIGWEEVRSVDQRVRRG
jgi:hypothetical protein